MGAMIQATKVSEAMPEQTTNLHARVPKSLVKQLQKRCVDDEISQQEATRRAIEMYLKRGAKSST